MKLDFITPSRDIDCPEMFKTFSLGKVRSAGLVITGLGMYRAFINGRRVGDDWLTPGYNDYDAYLRYRTYDVSGLLREGRNTLSVILGRGWCMSRLGPNSGDPFHWGRRFLLGARLSVKMADGGEKIINTDPSWRARRSVITMSEIYDGEHRDDTITGREEVPCIAADVGYHLEEPISPPIRAAEELKPVLLITPKGEKVLDFGQNFAGVIRFVNRLAKGESILIQTGEVLREGCFFRDNLNTALSEYRYVSDGRVRMIEPYFTFFGFRYAKVTGPERIDPEDFTGVALSSDLKRTLWCETAHPKLNRLMANAFWSQRSNFIDIPTDCPQRDERLGWTGDAQAFAATACRQMDCKAFYRKFMKDMRCEQETYYQGGMPMYVPSLKGEAGPGGAVWADAAVIIPWQVYWAYGDKALLRETYPMMRDYTETLIAADKALGYTHTVFDSFTFGDWLALDGVTERSVFGGTPPEYIQGVFYLRALNLTGIAAMELGAADEAARYLGLYAEAAEAMNRAYLTGTGRLAVDTQTGYTLALWQRIMTDRDMIIKGFRDRLRRDRYHIRCGFAGAPLLIDTMFKYDMAEDAYRLLLAEDDPSWLREVALGATTIWERWNSLDANGAVTDTGMNSFNHYAYGSVCGAVYGRIFGLIPTNAGYRKVTIRPCLSGRLRSGHLVQDTAAGRFEMSFEIRGDGKIRLAGMVPKGVPAEFRLPRHPDTPVLKSEGGPYEFIYSPTEDYLRPFGPHSLILDLLASGEGDALLKTEAPCLYELAKDPRSDVCVKRLDELGWGVPQTARREAMAILPRLRDISV